MKILVACEFSGRVRESFRELGHDAWSCDLLPSEIESAHHLQVDILTIIEDGWDMMIAFPPCTNLAISGARWFKEKKSEQENSLEFVRRLLDAPIPKIALENPVGIISTRIRKPDQIIQPYQFGEDASKKTCLWLKSLPKLEPTQYVEPHLINGKKIWANQTPSGQNKLGPSPTRAQERGRTYWGVARAMAAQWSNA